MQSKLEKFGQKVTKQKLRFIIRELRITDIYLLDKKYNSLSEKSKLFFHPGFLGTKNINKTWILNHILLCLSSIRFVRKLLLRFYPFPFLPLVLVNQEGKIVGFAYLKIRKRLLRTKFLADLGIVIEDNYQGLGLGDRLMEELIKFGLKERVVKITLRVLSLNKKAINLYKKWGFSNKHIKNGERWKGELYNYIEMELNLF